MTSPGIMAKIVSLVGEYPHLAAPLLGAGTGALTGSAFSEEGASGKGAIRGALLGSLIGGGAGLGAYGVHKAFPTAGGMTAAGAGLGGAFGGMLGQSKVDPWTLELLKEKQERRKKKREEEDHVDKNKVVGQEAQVKEAQVKEAAERILAFDFGIEAWCTTNQVDKSELAKQAGVAEEDFVIAAKCWFEDVVKPQLYPVAK